MQAEKKDIKSLLPEEVSSVLADLGEPAFRAKQVYKWLRGPIGSFEDMKNIPKALRERLGEEYYIYTPRVLRKQVSGLDGTTKYLWELRDGNAVETVIMRYKHGNTVCVSSQVGCRMGCAFCASTIGGKVRNLTASEILDQVMYSERDSGLPISNIVMMGIGEPLDNYDNVLRFLRLVNDPEGMNIGMRHISLSTCGLTDGIDRLGENDLQLTLSVSLHAPDDVTRNKIMPVNRSCGVEKLMDTCRRYFDRTGRRISFEYAMIDGVNDSRAHAQRLAALLRGTGSHVNLIPLNQVEESPLKPSKPENLRAFMAVLEENGINVTVRRKLGPDISASCGQLRRKRELEKSSENVE
ncbi:MAG: 23S rRNA (adenine(2503)-C(2))-methyltransferase RlmN [Oscillospiraceae bacterium]|nr:23S rRNA (adenine(2503)-C(2))-methyltransferase RlmN [Oscillospiraceae bacterium]